MIRCNPKKTRSYTPDNKMKRVYECFQQEAISIIYLNFLPVASAWEIHCENLHF